MDVEGKIPFRIESKFGKIAVVVVFFTLIVVTLLLTPLPNAPEETCDRPCHELEWPRICRFRFVLESYSVYSKECREKDHCSKDESETDFDSDLLVINRQIPGPHIHVCVHDILLIDVVNRNSHRQASIHWRGLTHRKNPLMDGVSMVSQCPIASSTTFQYKFRASDPGTHLWHLHNNQDRFNFVQGSLIVRQSMRQDPQHSLYDFDNSSHTIILKSIITKQSSAILVNGISSALKSQNPPRFFVIGGNNFRFRMAYAAGPVNCPITFSIENHTLLVISLDGNPIEPVNTTKITFVKGERLDFVVDADRPSNEYRMHFEFDACYVQAASSAVIVYRDLAKTQLTSTTARENTNYPLFQSFSTRYSEKCGQQTICLEDLKSKLDVHDTISNLVNPTIHYLVYGRRRKSISHLPGLFEVGYINNITFLPPSSPLASQISDIAADELCIDEKAEKCTRDRECQCTYIITLNLGQVVDLVLIDEGILPSQDHIFHLHGHKFYVLGRQRSENKLTPHTHHSLLYKQQILKDTIVVPQNGSAVIRFLAYNAGYWLLKEESSNHQGMQVVFHVTGHTYEVPETFPKCGNWVGPKYFLA